MRIIVVGSSFVGETRNTKEEFGKHVLGKYLKEEYVELLLSR